MALSNDSGDQELSNQPFLEIWADSIQLIPIDLPRPLHASAAEHIFVPQRGREITNKINGEFNN
jgi:hypothetical protein